jgi:hypothetical protein
VTSNVAAKILQYPQKSMTPPADLIECTNCDCWFAGASLDDVFYHATCACRQERATAPPPRETDAPPRSLRAFTRP